MGTLTAVHAEIRALIAAVVPVVDGTTTKLPTTPAGSVAQCVIVTGTPGVENYTRSCGGPDRRIDQVQVTCVAAKESDCFAVVGKVRAALAGRRLVASGRNGGRLVEEPILGLVPAPDVATDPRRWSVPLIFTIVTKGIR